jgi:hypothetical protein
MKTIQLKKMKNMMTSSANIKHFLIILLISIIAEKENDMTIKSYIQGRRIQSQVGKTIYAVLIPKTVT